MNRRIRILHVITTTIGGAGEHVLQLARGLDPTQFDVTVAFAPGMPLDDAFYAAGIRVIPVSMNRSAGLWRSIRGVADLIRLMRRERFDIVETHTSVAGVVGRLAARIAGVSVVIHMVHAYAGHDHVGGAKRRALTQVERAFDRLTDFYITGSDAIRIKGIDRGIFGAGKVRRIYYALDTDEQDRRAAEGGESIRAELGLDDDRVLVGFIGRLEAQKGVEYLLEAIAALREERPDVVWIIVGDGPQRGELETLADRLGLSARVRFLGWRKDVATVMRDLDIMAIPSRWEAFGIVNLEAMYAGVPVVGSRVEGIPEVVEDGVTGILVPPMNSAALAEALDALIAAPDRRTAMGAAGRERVKRHFTARVMVEQHEALFKELLAARRHGALRSAALRDV